MQIVFKNVFPSLFKNDSITIKKASKLISAIYLPITISSNKIVRISCIFLTFLKTTRIIHS